MSSPRSLTQASRGPQRPQQPEDTGSRAKCKAIGHPRDDGSCVPGGGGGRAGGTYPLAASNTSRAPGGEATPPARSPNSHTTRGRVRRRSRLPRPAGDRHHRCRAAAQAPHQARRRPAPTDGGGAPAPPRASGRKRAALPPP